MNINIKAGKMISTHSTNTYQQISTNRPARTSLENSPRKTNKYVPFSNTYIIYTSRNNFLHYIYIYIHIHIYIYIFKFQSQILYPLKGTTNFVKG